MSDEFNKLLEEKHMKELKIDPKPPKELFIKEGDEYISAKKWLCSECGNVNDEYWSDKCCRANLCNVCKETYITRGGWAHCDSCRSKIYKERERAYMASLSRVQYNGEAVYDIEDDEYYPDMEALLDNVADFDLENRPEFVEICRTIPIGKAAHLPSIIDHISEQVTENTEDEIELIGVDKLEKDIQEFLDKQTQYFIYERAQLKTKVEYE